MGRGEDGECAGGCGTDALAVTPRINQLYSNRNDAPACGIRGRRMLVGTQFSGLEMPPPGH